MRRIRLFCFLCISLVFVLPYRTTCAVRDAEYKQQLLQLFDDVDKNHNGKINIEEAINFLDENDNTKSSPNLNVGDVAGKIALSSSLSTIEDISPDELDLSLHNVLQGTRVWEWVSHAVGLQQYADVFRRNSITPLDFPILISDNGALLASELGILSVLHREKLVGAMKRQILAYGRLPGQPQDFSCSWGPGGPVLTWREPEDRGHPPLHKYVVERLDDKTGLWVFIADTEEALAVDAGFLSTSPASAPHPAPPETTSYASPISASTPAALAAALASMPRYRIVAWNLQGRSPKLEVTCKSYWLGPDSDSPSGLGQNPDDGFESAGQLGGMSTRNASALIGGGVHDALVEPSSAPGVPWEVQESRRTRAQSDRAHVNSLLLMIFPWMLRLIPLKYLLQLRRLRLSRASLFACAVALLRLSMNLLIVVFSVVRHRFLTGGGVAQQGPLRGPLATQGWREGGEEGAEAGICARANATGGKMAEGNTPPVCFLTASSGSGATPAEEGSSSVTHQDSRRSGRLSFDVEGAAAARERAPVDIGDPSGRPPPGGLRAAFGGGEGTSIARQRAGSMSSATPPMMNCVNGLVDPSRSHRTKSGGEDLAVRKGTTFFETPDVSRHPYSSAGASQGGVLVQSTTLGTAERSNTSGSRHVRLTSDPTALSGLSRSNSLLTSGTGMSYASSRAINIGHRGGSQRRLFCGFPGCERKLDMFHYKDYKQKHYCGRCQQMVCLEHTAYSPHGPTGDCGYESRCTCIMCFPRFSTEYQAFLMQRNTLLPYQQRQQLKAASISLGGSMIRGPSVSGRAAQAVVVAAAGPSGFAGGTKDFTSRSSSPGESLSPLLASSPSNGAAASSAGPHSGSHVLALASNYRSLPLLEGPASAPSSPPIHYGRGSSASSAMATVAAARSDASGHPGHPAPEMHMGKMLWSRALYKLKAVIRLQKDGQKKKKNKAGDGNGNGGGGGGGGPAMLTTMPLSTTAVQHQSSGAASPLPHRDSC